MAMEESLTLLNFWCLFFCFLMPIKAIWFRVGVHKTICSQFVEILLLFLENASFIHSIASVRQNSIVLWMNGASKKTIVVVQSTKLEWINSKYKYTASSFRSKLFAFPILCRPTDTWTWSNHMVNTLFFVFMLPAIGKIHTFAVG